MQTLFQMESETCSQTPVNGKQDVSCNLHDKPNIQWLDPPEHSVSRIQLK
jgi:hypothetical protein